MRIGIDARALTATHLKGIGRYCENLICSLSRIYAKHDYVLFCSGSSSLPDRIIGNDHITEVRVQAANGFLWEQWALPLAIRKNQIDVFHSPANSTMLWTPCPTILTLHDTMTHQYARSWGGKENIYWNTLQTIAYRRLNKIIAPSQFSKSQICAEFKINPDRVEVIYQGVSSRFRVMDREAVEMQLKSFKLPNPFIFAVGSKLERKNIRTLIEAFDGISQKVGRLELVIAGLQGYQPIEQAVNALRDPSRVRLLGYINEEELIAFYNRAALFIFPSLNEGFGIPPVEAMACGAPVIASNASCIPEVVGDGGLLVDCKTPEPLAVAMAQVLANTTVRDSLRSNGIARAKHFTWEETARKTLKVYEQAAQS